MYGDFAVVTVEVLGLLSFCLVCVAYYEICSIAVFSLNVASVLRFVS